MHLLGVAEDLCGRTAGKGGTSRTRNQGWWMEEVAEGATTHQLNSPVWSEEEGSQESGG